MTSNYTHSKEFIRLWARIGFIGTIAFFILAIIAYVCPLALNPTSNGIAFIGVSIAYLTIYFSFKEQLKNIKINEDRDERLIRIEEMVKKWDIF